MSRFTVLTVRHRPAAVPLRRRFARSLVTVERTTFVGVTADEVADGHTGLYEFVSADGHHVYLHDADLLEVTYKPGPLPSLTTTFLYDREWVPDSLRETPVIVITFGNVRILHWEEDEEALASMATKPETAVFAGQTSLFDWDAPRMFNLLTFALSLMFTADTAEVSMKKAD